MVACLQAVPFHLYLIRATDTVEVSILSLIWDGLIWAGCRPRSERESLSARRGPRGSNTHDNGLGVTGTPCSVLVKCFVDLACAVFCHSRGRVGLGN